MPQFVRLTIATNPLLHSIIEGILRDAAVPFEAFDEAAFDVILGVRSPINNVEFRVPRDRLQEAKDLLCANGVVCEVSDRLLKRALEEIVKPLLRDGGPGMGRLVHFITINNKETVRALFEATIKLRGGQGLLEEVFFELARSGQSLSTLARALEAETSAGFDERFESEAATGDKVTRIALLDVIPKFQTSPRRMQVLAAALLDAEIEIREAAAGALFELKVEDGGYDPEAPLEKRKAAVQKILSQSELE